MKDFCIVLMFDRKYTKKSWHTIHQIRTVGQYKGDIVCIIADDLLQRQGTLYKDDNIIIKHFKQYDTNPIKCDAKKITTDEARQEMTKMCFPMKRKMIHYHKIYCFHTWFREHYKKCFYIDTGTEIFKPLDKMINLNCAGKLLAHSNSYPANSDFLNCQFDDLIYPELYAELDMLYNLNTDHFQATVMLYDTSIIEDSTFATLMRMAYRYVNCKTNDQGILNLYFSCLKKVWQPLLIKDDETYFYDFYERGDLKKTDYIMVKYPKT
jgi:hypothetical protein